MAAYPPSYLKDLLGDAKAEALLSDDSMIGAMLRIEIALAETQAQSGDIPAAAAEAIRDAVAGFEPDRTALRQATERDGVVVPGLVAQLRSEMTGEARHFLHWGATSQDIADTAMTLCLRQVAKLCEERLKANVARLAALAEEHRGTVMAGRTRGQQAVPISFGLKAASWMMPLVRWHRRAATAQAEAFLLSLGGAAGTASAYGPKVRSVEQDLADRLELSVAPMPLHVQRDGLLVLGGWFAGLTASLGKIAADILSMAQSEVAELRLAGAGGSSTMPNKQNPTRAEAVVALAERASSLIGLLQRAANHDHERGGAAWMNEWQALPDLAVTAAAALRHTGAMLDGLEVDAEAMRRNAEASNGLLLAEAASFLLARHMARPDAQAAIKAACAEVTKSGRHLSEVLAERHGDLAVDWSVLRDPAAHLGDADAMIDRALAEAAQIPNEAPS